jgi:hypothetical protein
MSLVLAYFHTVNNVMHASINKELTLVKIASALGLGFASDEVK